MALGDLKQLLLAGEAPAFWDALRTASASARDFSELIALSALRKRAQARGIVRPAEAARVRLAVLGGSSLYPLHELLTHLLEAEGVACELFTGEFDNYAAEIREADGALYAFAPEVVLLLPAAQRCHYPGRLGDPRELAEAAAKAVADELLELAALLHERTHAEVLLGNFALPARRDLGELRARLPTSTWNFRKRVNAELALNAPAYVRICDLEFLAYRSGGLATEDAGAWFESKQPGSPEFLVELAREAAGLIRDLRAAAKKVLVLDLDNTLWGGVLADDGLEGVEIGDTSPRSEAFKAFQRYVLGLKQRGVLLAVCSKNDAAVAERAFREHPEMVLSLGDFVSFKANWEPKSDNLRQMAEELALGLDSFVFADDNPAEIEIVRQFTPAVATLLLDGDPAEFVGRLADSRHFEPRSITAEDAERTAQYRAESARQASMGSTADMASYLASLEMRATVRPFVDVDVPRLAQLINKSNQFNLTTRRRTEAEVRELAANPDYICLSLRLADKFGDHGLVSIVVGRADGAVLELDTWLMSCRVLKRQVEDTLLNEVARLAQARGCRELLGVYRETAKNGMVRDLYPRMGFEPAAVGPEGAAYKLDLAAYCPRQTSITLVNA